MTLEKISTVICKETGKQDEDIRSGVRTSDIVFARRFFVYCAKQQGYSYSTIGRYLNQDHSSVMSAYKKAQNTPQIIEKRPVLFPTTGKVIAFNSNNKYALAFERYGGRCAIPECGFDSVVEIAHIVPRSLGGTDEPSNLLVLCPNHHAMFDRGLLQIKDIHREG